MRVVIAGASGFLGTHLSDHLRVHGHEVTALVRREPGSAQESRWDPAAGQRRRRADRVRRRGGQPRRRAHRRQPALEEVGPGGARVAGVDHPAARRDDRRDRAPGGVPRRQRRRLVRRPRRRRRSPRTPPAPATRSSRTSPTSGPRRPTRPARPGARVCELRTSPVMDRTSPPLKQLRLLFQAGGGARLGSGEQFMPMISLRDWIGAVSYLIESRDVSGAFNLCCPHTPDQRRVHQGAGGRAAPQGLPRRPGTVAEAGRRRPRTRGARLGQRPTGSTRAGRLRLRGRGRARGAGRRAVLIAHLLHHPPRALADQHHPARRGSVDRQRHRRAGSDGLRTRPRGR